MKTEEESVMLFQPYISEWLNECRSRSQKIVVSALDLSPYVWTRARSFFRFLFIYLFIKIQNTLFKFCELSFSFSKA